MDAAGKRGQALGLNDAEVAFYDALATNDSAMKVMGDDQLKVIAAALVTKVRQTVLEQALSSRDKIKIRLRESIAAHLPAIITQLVTKAKEGDAQAARLLLERVLPALKPIEQAVALSLPQGEGITGQGRAIVQAVAEGTLAPGQGAQLLAGLGSLARIVEIDELDARLTKLEEKQNAKP